MEQDRQGDIDNIVPARGYHARPLVGLGGSAGSIAALQKFFSNMPPKSGMSFVVVMHLSPEHESTLPLLLGRWTKMQVREAYDGIKVEPDCVYVIPPARHLSSIDGHLKLTELAPEHGRRIAVDLFFRSLADTHGPHATAIVLSGADSDGAIGIKRIKERGGLTIAQEPNEAEHHSMPQSAIATGMVDWVLPVAEMPARLVEYYARETRLRMPSEDGPQPAQPPPATPDQAEASLREVLSFLRARTGRDFSYYKRATIVRRISRRMQINGVDDLPGYLSFLRTHPGETGALLQDMLISVTNFFRDRDAFESLEALIPMLFRGKAAGDTVRVWVPACATGEEAYSVAMLLMEHAAMLDSAPGIQIFGCDLDEAAIQTARTGAYPNTIIADVSEERLRRFFTREARGYRVRREVREIVLFAAHDLVKDAPFARMDLISCRNLMIYLNREAQSRVLDIFHFALRPHGLLFLGTSECVEEGNPLYEVVDKRHRIYRHVPGHRIGLPVPAGSSTLMRALEAREQAERGPILPNPSFNTGVAPDASEQSRRANLPLEELHFRLIERLAPPSVVVNRDQEIVHLSESAGRYLQLAGGEPTANLLRLVHPMLQSDLRAALFQAAETNGSVEVPRVPVDIDGKRTNVNLRVSPAFELAPGFLLVVFETVEASNSAEPAAESSPVREPAAKQLEREIETLRRRLRDTVEQHEANTEELRASNEELQAMNEELRSASEELETSREELQSINEELSTVNAELKCRIEELGRTNADLHNLMASTAIPTVFLDRDLRIMRYTPSAVELFSIIPSDLGRPLADLRQRLQYPEMAGDALRVLETLVPSEREVRAADHWYLARLLPYRTLEDHIGGVVLAFVDITESKRAEEVLRANEEQFHRAIEDAPIPVIMHAEDGQVLQISKTWTELTGYTQEDIPTFEAWLNRAYGPGAEQVREHMRQLFRGAQRQPGIEIDVTTRTGEKRRWAFSASAPGTLRDGRRYVVGMAVDVTDRVEELRAANNELRASEVKRVKEKETERRKIGGALHDDIGQVLTAVILMLKRARHNNAPQVELEEAERLVTDTLERVRSMSVDLRPHVLDRLGLAEAVRWHVKTFSERTKTKVHLRLDNVPRELPFDVATTALRVVQEALTNVARHSGAKEARVALAKANDTLKIEVRDKGRGFDPAKLSKDASGLAGLQEQVRSNGGKFTVISKRRGGTTLRARIPIGAITGNGSEE